MGEKKSGFEGDLLSPIWHGRPWKGKNEFFLGTLSFLGEGLFFLTWTNFEYMVNPNYKSRGCPGGVSFPDIP